MTTHVMTREDMDREIDLATAGSFPASDPPPWTLGATPAVPPMPRLHSPAAIAPAAIDVVIAAGGARRSFTSVIEVMAMTALIPVGIFVAAAPVLLAFWAFGVVSAWITGSVSL
jgi:hypothetical protein